MTRAFDTRTDLLTAAMCFVILATVGLAQYRSNATYGRELELMRDLTLCRVAIDRFDADHGRYPGTLNDLVREGYVPRIPVDPFTGSNSTWRAVPAEPDPLRPAPELTPRSSPVASSAGPALTRGLSDLESGSDGTSLAGTKYWSW